MENIIFVAGFFLFELLLMPIVYVVCLINIIISTKGIFTTLYYIFKWILFGILYLVYILILDVANLLNILSKMNGCKEETAQTESENEKRVKENNTIECFN